MLLLLKLSVADFVACQISPTFCKIHETTDQSRKAHMSLGTSLNPGRLHLNSKPKDH